jgi:hypothetical protein
MREKYYFIPKKIKENGETYIYLGVKCFTNPYKTYETAYCGALPQAFGGNDKGGKYTTIEEELKEESRGVIKLGIGNLRPIHNSNTKKDGKITYYYFYTSSNSLLSVQENWPLSKSDWSDYRLSSAYKENCAVVRIKMPKEPKTKIAVFEEILKESKLEKNYVNEKDNVIGLNNPESSLEYMNEIRFASKVKDKREDLKKCFIDFYESETFKAILIAVYEDIILDDTDDDRPFNIHTYFNDNYYDKLCDLIGAPEDFKAKKRKQEDDGEDGLAPPLIKKQRTDPI